MPLLLLKIRSIRGRCVIFLSFLPPFASKFPTASVELGMCVPLSFNGEWLSLVPLSPISSSCKPLLDVRQAPEYLRSGST